MRARTLLPLTLALLGCVSESKYDQAVRNANRAQTELTQATLTQDQQRKELRQKELALAHLDKQCLERDRQLTEAELRSSGLSSSLQATRAELDAVRRAKAASDARAALFRDVALKLKQQVDQGDVTIVIRDGRMVLAMPNDVLFDSGHTELKPAGQAALKGVAAVLKTLPQRHVQVAGHTDNVPIQTQRFPSNWELSSGRALEVVHFLGKQGVDVRVLSAAGYAEYDPVSTNDTPEGRRSNRRTEITLLPNIDEIVEVPNR